MKRFPSVSPKVQRHALLAVLLLACAIYAWQVAVAWVELDGLAPDAGTPAGAVGPLFAILTPTAAPTSVSLQSTDSSAARGLLILDNRGTGATLELWNMPVLSGMYAYQVWRGEGSIAESVAVFNITPETSAHVSLPVIVDHTLDAQTRFFVTIAEVGGDAKPSSPFVLRSR